MRSGSNAGRAGLVFRSRGMNLNLNHHPFVLKPQAMIMWVQPSLSSSQSCLSSSNCSSNDPSVHPLCVIQLVVDALSSCSCYSTCHGHLVKLVHKKSGSPISLLSVCWQRMACWSYTMLLKSLQGRSCQSNPVLPQGSLNWCYTACKASLADQTLLSTGITY